MMWRHCNLWERQQSLFSSLSPMTKKTYVGSRKLGQICLMSNGNVIWKWVDLVKSN